MTSSSGHTIIVGGTSPLGLACAQAFAQEGRHISLVKGKNSRIGQYRCENTTYFCCDLEQFDTLSELFEQIINERGNASELVFFQRYRGNGDLWAGEFNVSLRATQTLIDLFGNRERDGWDRSIVIVSSPADSRIAIEQPISYHAAKAALSQMIRYYAMTLGSRGIRVNGVRPGIVLKPRAKEFYRKNPDIVRLFNQITPLCRMGTPEDIADPIVFLCSPAARFITGQILSIDGGVSLHEPASLALLAGGLVGNPVTKEDRVGKKDGSQF